MGYLGGYQGDYLGGYRGDPGFFGFLGRAAKKVGGALLGATGQIMPGPGGIVARAASRALSGGFPGSGGPPGLPLGPMRPMGLGEMQTGRKRKRMNVTNPKALRRAIRRQAGFVKLAQRALKGTGYRITTRGAGRRRPISVRESGPGSVVVR